MTAASGSPGASHDPQDGDTVGNPLLTLLPSQRATVEARMTMGTDHRSDRNNAGAPYHTSVGDDLAFTPCARLARARPHTSRADCRCAPD